MGRECTPHCKPIEYTEFQFAESPLIALASLLIKSRAECRNLKVFLVAEFAKNFDLSKGFLLPKFLANSATS